MTAGTLASHAMIVLSVLIVGLAILFVLQQRRTPQSAAAWVLFILLVPYIALPVFLALGFRKQGSRFPNIRFIPPRGPAIQRDHAIADALSSFGLPDATSGNRVEIHPDAQTAREALFATIEQARTRIDIIFYMVLDDETGRSFVQALTAAVRRGVAVRLVLDRLGTLRRPRAALAEFTRAGGELRFFSPFLHPPDNGHLNLRNHRKMVIADLSRVWAGGRNIGEDYLQSPDWVDLSFDLHGPAVQTFIDVFASDWDVTGRSQERQLCEASAAEGRNCTVQVIPSGPDTRDDPLHDALVCAIHRARHRVHLATPYFLPTEPLGQALATAARRGVDVRIIVPERSNQWTADLARGAYLREVQRSGCTVLRYPRCMMHAKAGVIDDMAWIGTANFDVRSMLLNFEVTLALYDEATIKRVAGWLGDLERDSHRGVPRPGPLRRVVESLFRLGAPIL
ncbi:phospholipase D-like domain-containing protein [Brevirhabdus sp.]|uniref:phospholipase D-like domain-containing protein n=1 Tax=Brevirhabdus sp. TaxID=2004514 RepID=UPI004059F5A8